MCIALIGLLSLHVDAVSGIHTEANGFSQAEHAPYGDKIAVISSVQCCSKNIDLTVSDVDLDADRDVGIPHIHVGSDHHQGLAVAGTALARGSWIGEKLSPAQGSVRRGLSPEAISHPPRQENAII
jgi:hypothetical protein